MTTDKNLYPAEQFIQTIAARPMDKSEIDAFAEFVQVPLKALNGLYSVHVGELEPFHLSFYNVKK